MSNARQFVPYGRQQITESDIEAVVTVLRSDFLTTGPVTDAFEIAFANFVDAPFAAVCANGTAALHLCALALQLGPSDAVIVPTITFLATASAPHLTGAEVYFADVEPDTGLTTPAHVLAAAKRAEADGKTVRAVFPVHLNGQCVDIVALRAALAPEIAIIEDACHALGGRYANGSNVGSCGASTASIFSFHPVKSLTTGEGGMVTTRDPRFDAAVRLQRNHGMVRTAEEFIDQTAAFEEGDVNPWYYEMQAPGFNYRATDLACALGLSQLTRLDETMAHRTALFAHYEKCLEALGPDIRLVTRSTGSKPGWHLCVVLIDFDRVGQSRAELMRALRVRGIGTQVHYIPVHRQPYYKNRYGLLDLPGAQSYYQRCLSLPLHTTMSSQDVEMIVKALHECLNN
jgi:UDP-4-amino-4,6-dideoxy-N-acetyl-beta-L-altrosamine transaminase